MGLGQLPEAQGLEIYALLRSVLQAVVWLPGAERGRICYTRDTSSDHRNLEKGYGVKGQNFLPSVIISLVEVEEGARSSGRDFKTLKRHRAI